MKTFTVQAKTKKIAVQFDNLSEAMLYAASLETKAKIVQIIVNATKRIVYDSRTRGL
jgi:hypothetical protein